MSLYKYIAKKFIGSFEKKYAYDASYLHEVLDASQEAFQAFNKFSAMGSFRKVLPADVYFVSKIATAQTEDCGPCTELNVRMGREAGVPESVLEGARRGRGLNRELEDVRNFSIAVAFNEVRPGQVEMMVDRYGRDGLAELAVSIASMRVYPCMKRALGFNNACALERIGA